MKSTLVFGIETIPDASGLRKLLDLPADTSDDEVINIALHQCRQKNGTDFLPLHQHRVCAISCALRQGDHFSVWTVGGAMASEAEVIQLFYDSIEKYTPQIISWSGSGFDLPVLHYRGLVHGVNASRYWELGEEGKEFKRNNYISRYHMRHLDLTEVIAACNGRANPPLDDLAKLCGFPGKLGMDADKVWETFKEGKLSEIRDHCETDVAKAHLVFLRFQLMRGQLTQGAYAQEISLVRKTLVGYEGEHWDEFLAAWV